jgi:hypothetical protein
LGGVALIALVAFALSMGTERSAAASSEDVAKERANIRAESAAPGAQPEKETKPAVKKANQDSEQPRRGADRARSQLETGQDSAQSDSLNDAADLLVRGKWRQALAAYRLEHERHPHPDLKVLIEILEQKTNG